MKNLKTLLVCLVIFASCSNKSEDLNKAPEKFSITLGRADGGQIGVTWSEAIDLDGDTVTYDVYVDDSLKKSDLTIRKVVVDYSAKKGIRIKVIAKDTNGATTTATATKSSEV